MDTSMPAQTRTIALDYGTVALDATGRLPSGETRRPPAVGALRAVHDHGTALLIAPAPHLAGGGGRRPRMPERTACSQARS